MEQPTKPDQLTAADIQRAIEAAQEKRSNSNWRFILMLLALLGAIALAYSYGR